MIRISRKVDYGIIILSYLAVRGGKSISARTIAAQYGLSHALVANLLKAMTTARWVASARGVRGGYRLLRTPNDITLDALIEVVEGPYRFADCADAVAEARCTASGVCPAKSVMRNVDERIHGVLRDVSLADLAGLPASSWTPTQV